MSALNVAGVQVFVLDKTAYLEQLETQGKWRRLPTDGTGVSTERNGKRGLACVIRFLTGADYEFLLGRISVVGDPGAATIVPVVGDLTLGQTWQAFCWLGRSQWLSVYEGSIVHTDKKLHAPLTIKQA